MKKYKKFMYAALMVACLSCLFCQPAFAAMSESDVQSQVDAVGKETVDVYKRQLQMFSDLRILKQIHRL